MRAIADNSGMIGWHKEGFYRATMPIVGGYNQFHNNGNGYNSGYPYYGEHTYSGTGIFEGYFNTSVKL